MERKMYTLQGKILLPLTFTVKADSEQAALLYAQSIFNNESIIKMEADLYDRNDKIHYLLCDSLMFEWSNER